MKNKGVFLVVLLLAGFVILPGFSVSDNGSEKPTPGCGNKSLNVDGWLDGDNVAHVYFEQVEDGFEAKNENDAWGKMSYTFCGLPTRFVFNGHGLERAMSYALIAVLQIPEGMMMPQPMPTLLGEAMSNGGGNVHIKGQLPAEEVLPWDLYLVRAGTWEETILAAVEPITWSALCDIDDVCDQGALFTELS